MCIRDRAVSVYGYPNDIACWKGWSQTVYETGFAGFYESGQFADYPPVYIGVLYGIGTVSYTHLDVYKRQTVTCR